MIKHGEPISPAAWNDPEQRTLILRRALANGDGTVSILTLLLNPTAEDRRFQLPAPLLPTRVLLDSATGTDERGTIHGASTHVAAHSALLLAAEQPGGDA